MKKLLFLGLLLVSTISFGQIKIQPVNVGWPTKVATDLMVRVLPFETTATTCSVYYELKSATGEVLAVGNLDLTEQEFATWGFYNLYLENVVIVKLNLTRKPE